MRDGDAIDNGPTDESPQNERNRATTDELTRLLVAYRAKGHNSERPSKEQQDFIECLYQFIDVVVGVTRHGGENGQAPREAIGFVARKTGWAHHAEELADAVKKSFENSTTKHGELFKLWDESGGNSTTSFVIWKCKKVAQDWGRKQVIQALPDHVKDKRAVADRLIRDYQLTGKQLPKILVASSNVSTDSGDEEIDFEDPEVDPDTVDDTYEVEDKGLGTSRETPIASKIRVRGLVENHHEIAKDMPNSTVDSAGTSVILTLDHGQLWLTYVGMDVKIGSDLNPTYASIAEDYKRPVIWVERKLDECWEFYIAHPLFMDTVEKMIPNRLRKRMDDKRLDGARKRIVGMAKKDQYVTADLLKLAQERKKFVSLIHEWLKNDF